jgi:hypothetical protein
MGMPYAFIRVLGDRKEPFLEVPGKTVKQKEQYLRNGHMKDKFLGECLDSCRWGGPVSIMWDMAPRELIGFIQSWFQQNRTSFPRLFHERLLSELYTKFEFPYLDHKQCPIYKDKHQGKVIDRLGRTRCAHTTFKQVTPGYICEWRPPHMAKDTDMEMIDFWDEAPTPPEDKFSDDAYGEDGKILDFFKEELEEAVEEYQRYQEAPKTPIRDVCYAIISEPRDMLWSLEKLINRFNLQPKHEIVYCNGDPISKCKRTNELSSRDKKMYEVTEHCPGHEIVCNVEVPFDGWDMAFYVQKWYNQFPEGQFPPWFEDQAPDYKLSFSI